MPYAARRRSDGKWFKRVGQSQRELVDEIEKATVRQSAGAIKSMLRAALRAIKNDEMEIVRMHVEAGDVIEVVRLADDSSWRKATLLSVEKPLRGKFRTV